MKQSENNSQNFWTNKKVLVTGSAGFIGSHLTEALAQKGAQVTALVRYNSRHQFGWADDFNHPNIKIEFGDIRDADRMLALTTGCHTVFHLAAMISIPFSYICPSEAFLVNAVGTQNLMNACRSNKIERFIHTSTSEVYGTAQYVPINEKHPLLGQSPYSASKIAADQMVESYMRAFDFPATIVRPFNTFGPRQSARPIIPSIILQLLKSDQLNIGNLKPTRDFTFVTDTVAGLICAAEHAQTLKQTFNLGQGFEVSIADLVDQIAKIMKIKPVLVQKAERLRPDKSEVERLWSDNQLAQKLMPWQPRYSFEAALTATIDWYRQHQNQFQKAQNQFLA